MTQWLDLTLVAIGGAVGAVSRYLITMIAVAVPGGATPWGTTAANLLGCAGLAAAMEYSLIEGGLSPRASLAIRVGFLGSLTTFSTFAAEAITLGEAGRGVLSAIYLTANMAGGFAAFWFVSSLIRGWTA